MSGCPTADGTPTVAIVGAGLAGTLVAANLLRAAERPLRLVLIERRGDFGPGVAYSTRDERHLLNVPAARMSAFCDAPLHFLSWSRRHLGRHVTADEFLPRAVYGEYLRALLRDERERAQAATLETVDGTVEWVVPTAGGVTLELDSGRTLAADSAVLATGNLPTAAPTDLPDDPRVVADPWAPGALDSLADGGTTLLIGTSMTAIDVALSATDRAPDARVIAISRNGLLPEVHLPGLREPAPAPQLPPGETPLSALEQLLAGHLRAMVAEGHDWRDVVDGIRPEVPAIWGRLSTTDRRRFIDERMRHWDIRRHRLAPTVGDRLAVLREHDRFTVESAPVKRVSADRDGVTVEVGGERPRAIHGDRLVCCTGPGRDIRSVPAIDRLVADGHAVCDELDMGLRADDCGALLDPDGGRLPIHTLGPPRRGELLETTAAREIRIQAETIARDLCRQLAVAPRATAGQAAEPAA